MGINIALANDGRRVYDNGIEPALDRAPNLQFAEMFAVCVCDVEFEPVVFSGFIGNIVRW